jgi:hypothetical protein
MENLSLRPNQFTVLRRFDKGAVPYSVWRKWKQPSLRGLFFRGMFTLTSDLDAEITSKGREAILKYRQLFPELRKDETRGTFQRRLKFSKKKGARSAKSKFLMIA